MRTHPKQWTHHHTHRMYHLSLGVCFSFIAATLLWGSTLAWWQAQADNLAISAIVGGINPGPTVITGSGDSHPPAPQPAPAPPKVNIDLPSQLPEQEITLAGGEKTLAYVFPTARPGFSGNTNIPNALVFLEIHSDQVIRSTTVADGDGYWQWTAPTDVVSGFHTLTITAQHPEDSTVRAVSTMNFFIPAEHAPVISPSPELLQPDVGNKASLLDVFVRIPQQSKQIQPGSDVLAQVKLINFGSAGNPVDVPVEYTIENSGGEIIMQIRETVAVATQLAMLKTFYTSPQLAEGTYTIIARAPTTDAIALASDTFQVEGSPVAVLSHTPPMNYTLIYQILIGLFCLFVLIAYFEYKNAAALSLAIKRLKH